MLEGLAKKKMESAMKVGERGGEIFLFFIITIMRVIFYFLL